MRIAIPLLAALLFVPARPTVARPSFDALAARATKVTDLGHFLDDYVGDCAGASDRRACERTARQHRRKLAGHLYYTRLPDGMSRLLRVGRPLGGGRIEILLTPMFGGSGYGLTRGRPHSLDRAGNPRVALMPMVGHVPSGMNRQSVDLAVQTENVDMELIFRPGRVWHLSRHGHHAAGVSARFAGFRVKDARTGGVIVARVF